MADYAACGWHTIFKMGGSAMSLPEEVTRKWWDKKKQLVAKTSATGVGDELDKLQEIFKKIEWFWLSARPDQKDLDVEKAKKFMVSSEIRNLANQLKAVRELAKQQAVVMKKGALTKKTGEALDEMAKVADYLMVACNANSLSGSLETAIKDWDHQIREKFVKYAQPTLDAVDMVNKKLDREIAQIMDALKGYLANPDLKFGDLSAHSVLGNRIRDLCRDITQPLGNLMKSGKAGVPFTNYDEAALANLFKKIATISNTKGLEFMNDLDAKGIVLLINDVKHWASTFQTLTKDIAIA